MKKFEMPKIELVSFSQFENIAGKCGAMDDITLGEASEGDFE